MTERVIENLGAETKPTGPLRNMYRKVTATVVTFAFTTVPAMAQLPTTAPPTRGSTAGNYIQLMQDYAYDIFIFLGLALATLAFFAVSRNVIGAYGEVQDGKGTWGQLGMNFGAGVLLLVFVVFLLTEAAAIL
ncbi:TIGR03745 family integrating conjugative element membrane protein [Pseudohalioglobus lutimaris]|jgi:integrating conjugative element membrane protein (TIGR03745 family)|nr:TIGR03745 family integrating conjugative element membrane protein [Pseudohalioglobus lutimaris]